MSLRLNSRTSNSRSFDFLSWRGRICLRLAWSVFRLEWSALLWHVLAQLSDHSGQALVPNSQMNSRNSQMSILNAQLNFWRVPASAKVQHPYNWTSQLRAR
jgi:hypothetical protein